MNTPDPFAELLGLVGTPTAEDRMLEALLRELDPDAGDEADARADADVPDPELPPYAEVLDERDARAIVLWGGRGGAKSWTIARKLLVLAARQPLRILCTRETQASIADSSYKLLVDQIAELGLIRYRITQTSIRHPNGSEFIFKGLRDPDSVKSAEGVDIVWIEEAQRVSHRSLRSLIPTIRKPGSQVWISFNPDLETDPVYARYVKKPPPRTIVQKVGWQDNPWFHLTELPAEKDYDYEVDEDAAAWTWGGELRQGTEAQIMKGKWRVEAFEVPLNAEGAPRWGGPYYGTDFGFAQDPATLNELWIDPEAHVLYIRREAWKIGLENDDMAGFFMERVPGCEKHRIYADSARPDTISYLRRHGLPFIVGADKGPNSVEEGIRFLRQFRAIVIHPECKHTEQEFRLYSYKVDPLTNEVTRLIVDKHNHTIDGIRYALCKMIRRRKPGMRVYIPGAAPVPSNEEGAA